MSDPVEPPSISCPECGMSGGYHTELCPRRVPPIEPPVRFPRHDHYGRADNCSIDCPAHPDRVRADEPPSDSDDLIARVGALCDELAAIAGVSVRVDITVTVRMATDDE
jgi:hypothetical protein